MRLRQYFVILGKSPPTDAVGFHQAPAGSAGEMAPFKHGGHFFLHSLFLFALAEGLLKTEFQCIPGSIFRICSNK